MTRSRYPPPRHVLRDLPFRIEVLADDRQRAVLAPSISWSAGALATVGDVLGGSLCAVAVAPDWMATSSLTLWLAPVPDETSVVMDATLLRVGRRSVTIEVQLLARTAHIGSAIVNFSRLERRDTNVDLSDRSVAPGTSYEFEPVVDPHPGGFDDALDVRVTGARGSIEVPLTPYLANSFGALNGGVVAAIAASAATRAVLRTEPAPRGGPGGPSLLRVDEVSVHHLGQGRVGPVRAQPSVEPAGPDRRVVRVELRDAGATADDRNGRLVAVARVGVCGVVGGV